MARVRSVDFLPEIFQTDANRQFLAATLDQLVQEPKFKKTQGFIGRTVGPGVDPADKYVIEPTKTRADYQLEPGVISLDPTNTNTIKNAITYPGMADALTLQGADGARPDRLYKSQYYTWDPFVDLDSFVNFSQYYWINGGPDAVDVTATGVPLQETFLVSRENNTYTFSGLTGNLPTIDVVRGGNYEFKVAQNPKQTVAYQVTRTNVTSFDINNVANQPLTLVRGNTYIFNLSVAGNYPFWIKTEPVTGLAYPYNAGVTRNGATIGAITFTVPQTAPDTLYYQCETQQLMGSTITVVDGEPGNGPKFWIQTNPGVSGKNPTTPNISSREVLGVTNNGTDLGTITFNVPSKTAQDFYTNLNNIGTVDLVTKLKFDQIDGARLTDFIETYGGIDGITNLNTRTLIFANDIVDPVAGGWFYGNGNPVTPSQYFNIWRIQYTTVAGETYLSLSSLVSVPNLSQMAVLYGTEYSSTSWYKNLTGLFEEIPVLSAQQDTLYYQDGVNPDLYGTIRILEPGDASTLYISSILGQKTYTSPNGVVFTNGLKVQFPTQTATGLPCNVEPKSYSTTTVTVDCVSTAAGLDLISCNSTADLFVGQTVIFSGTTFGGVDPDTTYYIHSVFSTSQFSVSATPTGPAIGLTSAFGLMQATASQSKQYYVAGVGTSIQLLDLDDFYLPETSLPNFGDLSTPDYLTIERDSPDRNAWSRSNQWFHIDVLNATGQYNNTPVNLPNELRGRRPILQFRSGIRLYNSGTQGKNPIDAIDFEELDAFSNIEGSTGYTVYSLPVTGSELRVGYTYEILILGTTDWNSVAGTNGIVYAPGDTIVVKYAGTGTGRARSPLPVVDGMKLVFAADQDANVRNKIWVVNFITPDTVPPLIAQPIIHLTLASDGEVLVDQTTVVLQGQQKGYTFWYDGTQWVRAQTKTSPQQAPLFNVYDADGVSFGDRDKYPSSTFTGSKLLSYAPGEGVVDPVLQFALQYQTLENVGDIVFENNLYTDTFVYVSANAGLTVPISSGFAYEYADRTAYTRLLGWQTAAVPSFVRQQFKFTFDGSPLKLDVAALPNSVTVVPSIKVYVNNQFQDPGTYTTVVTDTTTAITFVTAPVLGSICEVEVLSNQTSAVAFYQVPDNLDQNPLNQNSPTLTLGTIRTHYGSICQNLTSLQGNINGPNNTRDLGDILPYGQIILQQSSPLTLAGYFLRSENYNIWAALDYNSREYSKFKNQLLEAVANQNIELLTPAQILDNAVADVTVGRTQENPFYWSDMLPSGSQYISNSYTVTPISTDVFDTVQVYDYTSANFLGMNVYVNNVILTRDLDYVVATDGPRITILVTLTNGDVVTINEYSATYGNYVPNTPSKMGLYPLFRPEIITVKTSSETQQVIVGHDGSQTPVFGDIRDDALLEFETRIFNNVKMDGNPVPLTVTDVLPGQFRATDYSWQEINEILGQNFLTYVGWNKLDYTKQEYNYGNSFTYNYSQAENKLDNKNLLGAWRGIYRYFYDTQQPEQTPWEMLGFAIKPDWWEITYSNGPWTANNLNLWDDLELGIVRDPAGEYILPQYARPGLTKVIPTDIDGALVPPLDSVVGLYDNFQWQKSWTVGDGGPVEASWWNSSDYPFAVMRLLALTRPAEFFALFADRDLYKYNTEFDQYLYNNRYRLDANGVEVYGDGVSKASYINWIVDYNKITGTNSTAELTADLKNLDVRLCYRMASFSDKKYIKLYVEKSSPNTLNTTLLIPDESYQLLVYKNQPFDRATYSAVVIQKTLGGWAVYGYSTTTPYFNTLTSVPAGQFKTFSTAGATVQVPTFYSNTITQIPYGYEFSTQTSVADFLLSYGKLLEQEGFTFTNTANNFVLDWNQMVQEFLYWSQQGWSVGSLINLNPLASGLTISKPQAIVDTINARSIENSVLDQNKREFPTRNLNIVRLENSFRMEPLVDNALAFADLRFTSFESMIVLDNASLFGDLIFDPTSGARQSRLNLVAVTSTEWNGSVDAQGFILNQNNVPDWSPTETYAKGEIVKYKNNYWSALAIVQPSAEFNYSNWVQSLYTEIELGLLPNIPNKADQLANSYNINVSNLNPDNDLLSYGLIGYKPRQYLAALNLNDVSQINVYRQFLSTMGTKLAIDLIGQAKLNKEVADYTVYENWGILRSTYGANANRRYIDLRLNQALLTSDPSLVEITDPGATSQANQQIYTSQVWKASFTLTSPNVFPTTTVTGTDSVLPNAGYVNFNDADITVFDINDPASLRANIDSIKVGTSIWVAKINDYDWNIYRAQNIVGNISHVCENLDGTCRVIFTQPHGLTTGDFLIIKYFDAEVNGIYRVVSVAGINTVNIVLNLVGSRTVVNGNGIGFTLQTMRVAQASDIVNLPYTKQLQPGAKVWVDNDGNGQWEVLEKQSPFTSNAVLAPIALDATEGYGAAVAQTNDRLALFVGSPNYGFGTGTARGGVYLYVKGDQNQYVPVSPFGSTDNIFTLDVTGARGFGNSISAAATNFAVAGASKSLGPAGQADNGYVAVLLREPQPALDASPWSELQLLTLPGTTPSTTPGAGEFGYSVSMSDDNRWIYVGAPGLNTVYAYGLVDWQDQIIEYVANGFANTVTIDGTIQIDNANQILVTQDGRLLTLGADYTVSAGFDTVTFTVTPPVRSVVKIRRKYVQSYAGGSASYNVADYLFPASNIYSITVAVDSVLQRPNIDYTFDGTSITFEAGSVPGGGSSVTVSSRWYYELAGSLTVAGLGGSDRFGYSVSCTTDGRQVIVGTPYTTYTDPETSETYTQAGIVYVFDRNVQKFIYNATATSANFTVLGSVAAPVSVIVNNQFLLNETDSVLDGDNTFTVSGNTVSLQNISLIPGTIVDIETNQFVLQQEITQNQVTEFTNFGQSLDICVYNCSLYIGAPQSSYSIFKGGVVERRVNQARVYGSIQSTVTNPSLTVGNTLRVNNVDCVVPAATGSISSLQGLANNISANAPNASATVTDGLLNIFVTNAGAAISGNKLQVAPGSVGTAFDDLGFETFAFTQTIESPYPVDQAGFGASLTIDDTAENLVVSAQRGSQYITILFDVDPVTGEATTIFDADATIFFSLLGQAGVVYTYDYFPSASPSVQNPGNFAFGQQITNSTLRANDDFGTAVSYRAGILIATAPGHDFNDSAAGYGAAYLYINDARSPAWATIYRQQPVVDIRLLSAVYMYDRITSAKTAFLDFFDPLQGKILGAAAENIDFISAIDPAQYNVGVVNNFSAAWNVQQIGKVWWDISTSRFVNPNQDSIVYAARRWGTLFPGSSVDVYQWVQSDVPPANYAGPGTVYSTTSYSVNTTLNTTGTFTTQYYFWVKGITVTNTQIGKTLPISTVASYIADPKASGIAYLAPLNASSVALYNVFDYLQASDTILSVEFDQQLTEDNVHQEFELIADGIATSFLSDSLYRKLQDSFCGADIAGNLVPDPNLPLAQRYGVSFRPRQSMFVDRFLALQNYLTRVNLILSQYPVSETKNFALLNSQDPPPLAVETVGATTVVNWNAEVANLEVLSYQNIYAVPLGWKYLVLSDSDNQGNWTIYKVVSGAVLGERTLLLTRVQNFNTTKYWHYIDWYQPGYNPTQQILYTVPNYASLATLSVPVGTSVKVSANNQGRFEIYLLTDAGWTRVGLQNGTIAFDTDLWNYSVGNYGWDAEVFDAQYWDQSPSIESRKIIQAINEQLLVDDLEIYRNQCLILMFNFVLSELQAPGWLMKTSLIDVQHRIRSLAQFQNYIRDNQTFVVDYIQEVKPYHVQIREFNLTYFGEDEYQGDVTDFDLPAYYNIDLVPNQYTSPILLPYTHSDYQPFNYLSDTPASSPIWSQWPYNQWYSNFTLFVDSIRIVDGGSGYTEVPQILIVTADGDTGTGAEAVAQIQDGTIVNILVVNPGQNYQVTPSIIIDGSSGAPARAYAVMANAVVRKIKTTIKYDRYQYLPAVETWVAGGTYVNGTLVRFDNRVWRAVSYDGSSAVVGTDFNFADWQLVPAAELSGMNRTQGFYQATANEPGLDIHQLIPGTSYPGVQVWGDYFLGSDPNPLTVVCTSSSATTNEITCSNTLRMTTNSPIRFYGSTFGGIVAGQVYYIRSVLTTTTFTLTNAVNGPLLHLTTGSGSMVAWIPQPIDATYASSFTDQYLGLKPTDINVDGGKFIGPFEGFAPEELVNGSEYDTLDLRVYTRPGSDWLGQGFGFQFATVNFVYNPVVTDTYSWANAVHHPAVVNVFNETTGLDVTEGIAYTLNYADQTVTIVSEFAAGDVISVTAYEVGGGSQLYRMNYTGAEADGSVIVPVNYTEIYEIPVFVNGNVIAGVTWEPYADSVVWDITQSYARQELVSNSGNFYRALQSVPPGVLITDLNYWTVYVPTLQTKVNFNTAIASTDGIYLSVMGYETPQHSWSTLQTETFVADAAIVNTKVITVSNSLQGTNPANLVVTRNGRRLNPPADIEWFGDGTSVDFGLPQRLGFDQNSIDALTDIQVWVDNELQTQSFGAIQGQYSVTNWTGSNVPGRQVRFVTPPPEGARILISVSTNAWYYVIPSSNQIQLIATINLGDIVSVTSWNDTSQQNLVTLVYVGPVETSAGGFTSEGYDTVPFDSAAASYDPGSFDYGVGVVVATNQFYLRPGQTANRLWVTLNGFRLLEGKDYTVANDELILASGPIGGSDVMVITEFAEYVTPEAMAFRIFQDMRGVQTTFRITDATTTALSQDVTATADVIYVDNVQALSEPNLALGYFGVMTIDGERILYRERDTLNSCVSGLFRGTAGTGAAPHTAGTPVYDMGLGNRMPAADQNYITSDTTPGDGSTTVFYAPNISISAFGDSSTIFAESIEVYVGGIRAQPGMPVTQITPGNTYTIASIGNTDWYAIGLPATEYPAPGVVFTATANEVAATALRKGHVYTILSVGTTDFTAVGASSNTIGVTFTATGAGQGTGTASGFVDQGVVGKSFTTHYYQIGTWDPLTIEFVTADDLPAPAAGVEVTILERHGVNWYQPGANSASDGRPLQLTETAQARFLRGL